MLKSPTDVLRALNTTGAPLVLVNTGNFEELREAARLLVKNMLAHCLEYPGARALVLTAGRGALHHVIIPAAHDVFSPQMAEWRAFRQEYEIWNGSKVRFAALETEDAWMIFGGYDASYIGWWELERFSLGTYRHMMTRLRGPNARAVGVFGCDRMERHEPKAYNVGNVESLFIDRGWSREEADDR